MIDCALIDILDMKRYGTYSKAKGSTKVISYFAASTNSHRVDMHKTAKHLKCESVRIQAKIMAYISSDHISNQWPNTIQVSKLYTTGKDNSLAGFLFYPLSLSCFRSTSSLFFMVVVLVNSMSLV